MDHGEIEKPFKRIEVAIPVRSRSEIGCPGAVDRVVGNYGDLIPRAWSNQNLKLVGRDASGRNHLGGQADR
jgi:hypothetical protein